jgi:DSBA-like thioredoxin domain
MKHITFYLDFISPYAYLAFERLPIALQGLSYQVTYKPVLFAALLNHHGQLGPAEIAPKRTWTYRQMLWLAREHGVPMQAPASHPFNPLALLRLAVACGKDGACNRYVSPCMDGRSRRSRSPALTATHRTFKTCAAGDGRCGQSATQSQYRCRYCMRCIWRSQHASECAGHGRGFLGFGCPADVVSMPIG